MSPEIIGILIGVVGLAAFSFGLGIDFIAGKEEEPFVFQGPYAPMPLINGKIPQLGGKHKTRRHQHKK